MERICINCNHYFPDTDGPTEFGICLNDEEFEPFIEELLENSNYVCCQELIDRKKFSGEQEACLDFEEVECIEIGVTFPQENRGGSLQERDFRRIETF